MIRRLWRLWSLDKTHDLWVALLLASVAVIIFGLLQMTQGCFGVRRRIVTHLTCFSFG